MGPDRDAAGASSAPDGGPSEATQGTALLLPETPGQTGQHCRPLGNVGSRVSSGGYPSAQRVAGSARELAARRSGCGKARTVSTSPAIAAADSAWA